MNTSQPKYKIGEEVYLRAIVSDYRPLDTRPYEVRTKSNTGIFVVEGDLISHSALNTRCQYPLTGADALLKLAEGYELQDASQVVYSFNSEHNLLESRNPLAPSRFPYYLSMDDVLSKQLRIYSEPKA